VIRKGVGFSVKLPYLDFFHLAEIFRKFGSNEVVLIELKKKFVLWQKSLYYLFK